MTTAADQAFKEDKLSCQSHAVQRWSRVILCKLNRTKRTATTSQCLDGVLAQ